jgi:adenosylmethionine---8-amino-7-oxononanoate aminotransferase
MDPASWSRWERLDRQHVWHAFSQMADYHGLIIEKAEGCWLTDITGRRLLDGVSSLWCNVHGHRHPALDAAVRRQLDQVAHVTGLGMSHPVTLELTETLLRVTPDRLQHVFYSSDGSSAVEVALKIAFQYWRQIDDPQPDRDLFIALGSAYHGDTLGSVSVGGISRFHAMFEPLLFRVLRGPCPDARLAAAEPYLQEYQRLLERHAGRVAAVVVEPLVQCAAGMITHPPGFLAGLRRLCDQYQVLLIADEIAVGTGRTGRMWGCEQEAVAPDILCTGKGLSGGYLPLAATLTSTPIWEAFLGPYEQSLSLFHGHTYSGNPLSCAAALASLQLLEQPATLAHVRRQAQRLADRLSELVDHPHVGSCRQVGLLGAVELVASREHGQPYRWAERRGQRACDEALRHNVWLRPLGNVIVIMPPLCINDQELDQLCAAVAAGVEVATAD